MSNQDPTEGVVTIKWRRLPEQHRAEFGEFDFEYVPQPPLDDLLAARLLRYLANMLEPLGHG